MLAKSRLVVDNVVQDRLGFVPGEARSMDRGTGLLTCAGSCELESVVLESQANEVEKQRSLISITLGSHGLHRLLGHSHEHVQRVGNRILDFTVAERLMMSTAHLVCDTA